MLNSQKLKECDSVAQTALYLAFISKLAKNRAFLGHLRHPVHCVGNFFDMMMLYHDSNS